ncbi:hypothetical protein ACJX0J_032285 [Zea mays]
MCHRGGLQLGYEKTNEENLKFSKNILIDLNLMFCYEPISGIFLDTFIRFEDFFHGSIINRYIQKIREVIDNLGRNSVLFEKIVIHIFVKLINLCSHAVEGR